MGDRISSAFEEAVIMKKWLENENRGNRLFYFYLIIR